MTGILVANVLNVAMTMLKVINAMVVDKCLMLLSWSILNVSYVVKLLSKKIVIICF